MNSRATSVMAWRLLRSAIAARLVYFREIDPAAFWELATLSKLKQTCRTNCVTFDGEIRGRRFSGYLRRHSASDLRVSIALLARAVACGSPYRIWPTRSGDSQARWIRLLT